MFISKKCKERTQIKHVFFQVTLNLHDEWVKIMTHPQVMGNLYVKWEL